MGIAPFLAFDWGHPWCGLLLAILGVGVFGHALMERTSTAEIVLRRRFVACITLLALVWGTLVYDIYDRRQAPQSAGMLIMGYSATGGNPAHGECVATLNGFMLSSYRNDYRVALACGIWDATVDWPENRVIQVSQPFSIQDGPIEIRVHFSKPMIDMINDHLSSQATGIPEGQPVTIQYPLYYQAILLPKNGSCQSDIQRLSDIQRCGGKLLPQVAELNGIAVRQIALGLPRK